MADVVDPPTPPSSQMLLAVHHARYTQLLRAFLAWKRRAQAQCARRKRVAAACRVGSVFYERIFWTRWREFVAERRQERQGARENEMKKLEEGEELPGPDEKSTNNADVAEKADAIVSASDGEENREEGAAVLKTKKHYLKRWELGVEHDKKNAEIGNSVIVRIRSMHAIRRWRRLKGEIGN
ncbi:uncharacterized protein IUM83_07647 [Phytophthora cinnamomi]|uniref:uncharacterized protein n=1 Tax=Phytophthora cinnamomi TaxID=4785 RepID=UPI00355A6F56|nr:hypothetical protein IUM83_07647 [Phytophthora cinnamomi]